MVDSIVGEDQALKHKDAEIKLLNKTQAESFPMEIKALTSDKSLTASSHLCCLSPIYKNTMGLIRVGGRLCNAVDLELKMILPVVLNSQNAITKLLIKEYDNNLFHPGPERVFTELRRTYWILRGREAVCRHQFNCLQCRKWQANPEVPKMVDLPAARL